MALYTRGINFLSYNLTLIANEDFLIEVKFKKTNHNDCSRILDIAQKELLLYSQGVLKKFNIPIKLEGSKFQLKCWEKLLDIPYGKTVSYKEQAILVGGVNYSRAVAGANNKNKLPIIVPCHRVIGSNGKLVGYAGGLELKQSLVSLEA